MEEKPDDGTPFQDEGKESFEPRSWGMAFAALAAAVLVVLGGAFAGILAAELFARWAGLDQAGEPPVELSGTVETARLAVALVATQVATILLTIPAAMAFERRGRRLLPLHWPEHGAKIVALSLIALFSMMMVAGAVAYYFDRSALETDVKPFADMARTPVWWSLFIAAAIGAPIAEELLFRGLLFGVLRDTRLGIAGSILTTAAMWSVLHAQYSLYGITAIFCIGLYLGWLRQRTGSLLPPMIVHGLYNGLIVIALAFATEGGAAAP